MQVESSAVGLDHGGINHSIWSNCAFGINLMENFLRFMDLSVFDASINKASKGNVIVDLGL